MGVIIRLTHNSHVRGPCTPVSSPAPQSPLMWKEEPPEGQRLEVTGQLGEAVGRHSVPLRGDDTEGVSLPQGEASSDGN